MKIYFATTNSGKVKDAQSILPGFEVEQLDVETVEPSIDSIEEIALSKVQQAVEQKTIEDNAYIIADDSGLFVEELNGFPGPQTSFFDRKVGKTRLLDLVDEGATAEFRAAIAVHIPGKENQVFTGKAKGEIVESRGDGGFGYDPLFLPEDNDKTWGQEPEFKDEKSHRKEALTKLREKLSQIQ